MTRQIMISFGELYTKGKNRKLFVRKLKDNIKHALKGFTSVVQMTHDHIYVRDYDLDNEQKIVEILKDISGIYYVSIVELYPRDIEAMEEAALHVMRQQKGATFKVHAKRIDKAYPLISDQINRRIAGFILKNTDWKVDVRNPDFKLDIKVYPDGAYFVVERHLGAGGYPLGMIGSGLLMLSGGIDSPVAGYVTLRRGIKLTCIHFASPPYTQEGVIYKLKDLLRVLNRYQYSIDLYVIPFTRIQESIYEVVKPSYTITIMRRMMYRLAEGLAKELNIPIIINGESLAQVASQTLESVNTIGSVTNMPVIRPLAMMDKTEIIDIARRIKTYDISIQPYEDCCTIFPPENPETKPSINRSIEEEGKFEFEELLRIALENKQLIRVKSEDDLF